MTLDEIKNIKREDCEKFSSFAKMKLPLPGIKKHLDEILNKEIIITDFRVMESKHRPNTKCLEFQFIMDGNVYIVFTGSSVLLDQITEARDNMPFSTTIIKPDRFYSMS